ncbi:MAG: 1-acyl-sn-glycerol-3-phosphate acyltransferase [Proteobacteria bacterium]|nr:1-acyl-sn-glycerol-3-phosphate acyltransferase [Pseudomonadota bacterium]
MTLLRSAIFFFWFALVSATLSILCVPLLLGSRSGAGMLGRTWSRLVFWGLRVFAGTNYEVRGAIPKGRALIAIKHMSMWDTCAIYTLLGDPAIVLKRGLQMIPFYGWYLWKAGMIPIDRDGKASALRNMVAAAKRELARGRSVVIFPEGTRKKPGMPPDYKPGVAGLYGQLDVPCVPVALNSGVFWTGFIKKPGTIVIEFLDPIPPGLSRREFMPRLEAAMEGATAKLVAEGRQSLP